MGSPRAGPLVNPGKYALELDVAGKRYSTSITILPDPRQQDVKPDELADQLRFLLRLRDEITQLTRTVESLRLIRKQLDSAADLLKKDDKAKELLTLGKSLGEKLKTLEEELHNPRAEVAYDILAQKGGAKLYSQLVWLYEQVRDADGIPGQGFREVHAGESAKLERATASWQAIVKDDVARYNILARKLDLPVLIVSGRK
jgi:hypothetical protein